MQALLTLLSRRALAAVALGTRAKEANPPHQQAEDIAWQEVQSAIRSVAVATAPRPDETALQRAVQQQQQADEWRCMEDSYVGRTVSWTGIVDDVNSALELYVLMDPK